jgi:hypothetical protein
MLERLDMAVYVDDVRHPYRNMIMCHMWADTLDELLTMADQIGVARRWLQTPPKASWTHFDISISKKDMAIRLGAILTDRYGPLEHVSRLRGDQAKIDQIQMIRLRADRTMPSSEPGNHGGEASI